MSAQDVMDFNSGMMAFEAKQFARAMQFLSPIAAKGDPTAMHRCAIMCQNGLGVAVNKEAAFRWMKKAAEAGDELAQHGLGFMYMEGDCVAQNGELAVKWFTAASEQGLQGAQTTLGMMYEQGIAGIKKDPEKAKAWYARAGFTS